MDEMSTIELTNTFMSLYPDNWKLVNLSLDVKPASEQFEWFERNKYKEYISKCPESISKYKESVCKYKESVCKYKDSISKYKQSMSKYKESMSKYKESISKYKQSISKYKESMSKYKKPISIFEDYISKYGYVFNKLIGNDKVIWESGSFNELSRLVLVYGDAEKYVLVIPNDSNLILFHRQDNTWKRINSQINLAKLKMCKQCGDDSLWDFSVKLEDCEGPKTLEDLSIFDSYYYDLDKHNFKIIFNAFCHNISYDGNEIWKQTEDNARYGNPSSLNFDLISGDVTITFIDGTIQPLHINRPSLKRPRDQTGSLSSVNLISDNEEERVNDSMSVDLIFLDTDMKMSATKYRTDCDPDIQRFVTKNGFVFAKIKDDGSLILDTNDSRHYLSRYKSALKIERTVKKCVDYFKFEKPTVDSLKFYTRNNKELRLNDSRFQFSIFRYRENFFKALHKIIYKGKIYKKYDFYKHEGFPVSLYLTHVDFNITLKFYHEVPRDMKIGFNLLKMYKMDESGNQIGESVNQIGESVNNMDESVNTMDGSVNTMDGSGNKVDGSGNKVELVDEDYEDIKGFGDTKLYTLRDDVKCTKVSYDELVVWEHSGEEYPKSIFCDYNLARIEIRFSSYVCLFVRLQSSKWLHLHSFFTLNLKLYREYKNGKILELSPNDYRFESSKWFHLDSFFPLNLKLYREYKNGETVELSPNDYRIKVLDPSTIEYIIKAYICSEIRFEDSTLWKRQTGQPFPRKIIRNFEVRSIVIYSNHNRSSVCVETKLMEFKRNNGIWKLEYIHNKASPNTQF